MLTKRAVMKMRYMMRGVRRAGRLTITSSSETSELQMGKIQGYLPTNLGVPTWKGGWGGGHQGVNKISLPFWMIQTMFKNK